MGRRRRHHHQGHQGPQRGGLFQGEPFGINPGDDIGNRKAKDARPLPPDDIGNRKEDAHDAILPPDDVGNRVDAMPTHDLSGVLTELHAKRPGGNNRPRRARKDAPQVRLGRYVLGGVNPLVSLDQFRAQKAQEQENERRQGAPRERPERVVESGEGAPVVEQRAAHDRRRREGDASASGERRSQRFFDLDEDDRFEYTLTSTPDEKREAATIAVREIVTRAGRDAVVSGHVIEDGERPKVIVTIDERGPSPSLPPERRGRHATDPLFVLGQPALMSLNYLVNKIVNRYPGDRIRLIALPAQDLAAYQDALAEHRQKGAAPRPVVEAPAALAIDTPPEPVVVDDEDTIVTIPIDIGGAPVVRVLDDDEAELDLPAREARDDDTASDDAGDDEAPAPLDDAPPAKKSRGRAAAPKKTADPKPRRASTKKGEAADAAAPSAPAAPPKKRAARVRPEVETAILPAVERVVRPAARAKKPASK